MGSGNNRGVGRDAFAQTGNDGLTKQELDRVTYGGRQPDLMRADSKAIQTTNAAKFTLVPMGIEIAKSVTAEELLAQVRAVHSVKTDDFWHWADLMGFAEAHEWEGVFAQTENITGIPVATLKVYAWLSRAILPILRGIEGVKLTHYKLIAKCKAEHQQQYIQRLLDNKWTTRQLDAAINGDNIPPTPPPRKKSASKPSAYAQTADKLAKFESGAGGFRSHEDARAAIADMRQWLNELEAKLR